MHRYGKFDTAIAEEFGGNEVYDTANRIMQKEVALLSQFGPGCGPREDYGIVDCMWYHVKISLIKEYGWRYPPDKGFGPTV